MISESLAFLLDNINLPIKNHYSEEEAFDFLSKAHSFIFADMGPEEDQTLLIEATRGGLSFLQLKGDLLALINQFIIYAEKVPREKWSEELSRKFQILTR